MPPTSKTRRHSGRTSIFVDDDSYPFQESYYNNWTNYRDGMRYDADDTHIRNVHMTFGQHNHITEKNAKLKKLEAVRRAKRLVLKSRKLKEQII